MEMLVVYGRPSHDYLHWERFEDDVEEARKFAKEEHGVLFMKEAGAHVVVESYLHGTMQKIAERIAQRRREAATFDDETAILEAVPELMRALGRGDIADSLGKMPMVKFRSAVLSELGFEYDKYVKLMSLGVLAVPALNHPGRAIVEMHPTFVVNVPALVKHALSATSLRPAQQGRLPEAFSAAVAQAAMHIQVSSGRWHHGAILAQKIRGDGPAAAEVERIVGSRPSTWVVSASKVGVPNRPHPVVGGSWAFSLQVSAQVDVK